VKVIILSEPRDEKVFETNQKDKIYGNSNILITCQLGKILGHTKPVCSVYCAIEHSCPITYLSGDNKEKRI
jgi:hypothetical protein